MTRCVTTAVGYAEGLRWAHGRLYWSDMLRGSVAFADDAGVTTFAENLPAPSGLGFASDGSLLVVARGEDRLYRLRADDTRAVAADLAAAGCRLANELVTDGSDVFHVGCLGTPYEAGDEHRAWDGEAPGRLYAVDLRGARPAVREVARDLACPNGMVITPDRSTLIVAETYRSRLTAFERGDDGSLRNRRVLVRYDGGQPDGLALDRAGGIWAGLPYASEFVRVDAGGEVTDRIAVPGEWAVGCALGGPDRTSLYMAVCTTSMPELQAARSRGRILVAPVAVPGAGWP